MGFTLLSPPIVPEATPGGYTQDWAIIELDLDKFDPDNFEGNAIDLGRICRLRISRPCIPTHATAPASSIQSAAF